MKLYTEPEIEIREYSLAANRVFTESDPAANPGNNNNNDDEYDYFGNN
ncbi:MAG: hypothetical protein IJ643_11165 [Eubacterium sp.]|nr:hypothetical protein [Eubacterium sp.]